MARYKLKNSNTWVTLASKPFASGGEGNLYAITEPLELRHYVAKIYHPHKLSETREQKINYLADFPPVEFDDNENDHTSVVWVKDALYDHQKFVGFIMPFTQGEKLEVLCTPKIPNKLKHTWRRFDFNQSSDAADVRLKLCFNICAAIHQVHSTGRYVLVDMKPDNIVIQPNGLVSIVDTDSVEVIEDEKSIFDAPVATPEYTPPEHYQNLNYDPTETEEWDRFGLGVILYKLLFGVHPFAASSGFPHEHLVSLSDKIEHGLFVHHPAKQESFTAIPPPHKAFYTLDASLQALFMRCFIDGHYDPRLRPSAEEWCSAILLALNDETFFKRYEHILGGVPKMNLPRFVAPSTKIQLPNYSNEAYQLVELNKENNNLTTPSIQQPSENELKKFSVKTLTQWEQITLIVILGIASTIGTPILGFVALGIWLRRNYKAYKRETVYRHQQVSQKTTENIRQRYKYKTKKVHKAQRKFKWSVRWILPKIEKIGNKIQQEVDALKAFLKSQDQRVATLEKEAIAEYKKLNKHYADIAQKDRLVARMNEGEYDSLSKIKIAIDSAQKKAIDLLNKQHPISNNHPDLIEGKTAIDSLVKDKKMEISELTGTQLTALEKEENEAIEQLFQPLQEETNFINNLDRLWKGRKLPSPMVRYKMVQVLQEAGCLSVLDIDAIDNSSGWISLRNGNKINVRDFFDSKTAIKNLYYWLDETKHQLTTYEKEKEKIKAVFQVKKQELADKKRIELKGLENLQKKELAKVKIGIQKEVLGAPFSNLQQQYETVTQYVEELEVECEKEEEVLLQNYKELYQEILLECELRVAETEEKIASMQKDMDYYNKKAKSPKVQARYQELKKELEELQQLVPTLEQKEFEFQQYQNITFLDYLKQRTGRFQFK